MVTQVAGKQSNNRTQQIGNRFIQNKAQNAIEQNYRNKALWHVLGKYDNVKVNGKLDVPEITQFQEDVSSAAGSDRILDIQEIDAFADRLGVSSGDLRKSIHIINAEILSDSLISALSPRFGSFDEEASTKLLNQINSDNVSEVWDSFQSSIDKRYSIRGFSFKDTSLANEIIKNYDNDKVQKFLDRIYNSMVQDCQRKKIDITTLKQKYTAAKNSKDNDNMDVTLREIGARLNYHTRLTNIAHTNSRNIGGLGNGTMNDSDKAKLNEIAESKNIKLTKDVVGDGIVGNTESVVVDPKAKVVFEVVEELLNDKAMKEQIQSCVKKDSEFIAVYFPARNTHYSSNEHGLINATIIERGVIGDGDMSVLVTGILKQMQERNFKNTNDKAEVKQFVTDIFTRDLTGITKLRPKM